AHRPRSTRLDLAPARQVPARVRPPQNHRRTRSGELVAEARHGVRLLAAALAAAALLVPAGAHAAGTPDCDGAPPAAQPNTPEWNQREAENVFCGTQRSQDAQSNPAYNAAALQLQAEHGGPIAEDPFRDPAHLNGKRFRFERVSFKYASGGTLDGMLFRPLRTKFAPPYPGVVIVHGGAATQEMYLWGAEALAE